MIHLLARGLNFLLGKRLHHTNVFIGASLQYLHRRRIIDKNYFDYIRLATLELVSHELRGKHPGGHVAELGVYKGKFAKYINQYFPERTMYLFDTFQGFDERDVRAENQKAFSKGSQNFSDTSVDAVMKLMPYPEKCIPVKGFFPESATGVDGVFVFVSLDTDLYEPIYSGLQFFYPRLCQGGYI